MFYEASLGRQGNIEKSLQENQYRKNEIQNEENTRKTETRTSENAMCELDESIESRIADIELALCELDEGGQL